MLTKFLLLLVLSQTNQDPGLSPAMAIILENERDVSRGVTTSVYYSMTASDDGILDLTMTPITGDADLTLVHFSGSPTIETRREGLLPEVISTRVRKGDRYLIRVFSPFGRPATFRLRATVVAPLAPVPSVPVVVPREVSFDGRTESGAFDISSGLFIPVEATGTRFFKVVVPRGHVLAASVYPIRGEVDLALIGSQGQFALSRRPGMAAEHLYLHNSNLLLEGNIVLRVTPTGTGDRRYILMTRLLRPGVTDPGAATVSADPETIPLSQISLEEIWSTGKVLRLP